MKTMVEYEIIQHDKIKDIRIFFNTIKMRSLHMHHDMELLLVTDGEGLVSVKNRQYRVFKGDILIINAYESHEIISRERPLTFLIVQFSNHFLRDYFHAIRNAVFSDPYISDKFMKQEYEKLLDELLELAKAYFEADGFYELKCVSLFADILSKLYSRLEIEHLSESEYSKRKKANRRIEAIADYIDANYLSQIRLSDIADAQGLTVTHLSHFISEHFGMSFQDYLREKRLSCAVRLILDPSLTLSEVSANSGFSELKYMNAAFEKTFDMSPEEYRRSGLNLSLQNKKGDVLEYIYAKERSIELLQDLHADTLLK